MSDNESADRPLRLAVLISGGGSTLANLIARINGGRLTGIEIRQVISSRRVVKGVTIAQDARLPVAIIRRRDFGDDRAFSDAITTVIDHAHVDLVVFGGFLRLWGLPERYSGRTLNIHPALLPKFGGKGMHGGHVHAAVLAAGETESGCTVHLVDDKYDHGRILGQQRVPVLPDDDVHSLADRVFAAECELYPRVLKELADDMAGG